MDKRIKNFFRVFWASITKPLKVFVLGVGIFVSLIFPQTAILMIIASLASALAMSFSEIQDQEFIDKVLNSNNTASPHDTLESYLLELERLLKQVSFSEVKSDLEDARGSLQKIIDIKNYTSDNSISFADRYIQKILDRLINLIKQEDLARRYISIQDVSKVKKEIESYKNLERNVFDKVAKREYARSVSLKEDQLVLIQNLNQKLDRIDSYVVRIRSTLDSVYASLAKASLKDQGTYEIDDGEILVESLKGILTDIDEYESRSMDIESEIQKASESDTKSKDSLPIKS